MPNWCHNRVTMSHSDPAMIQRAYDAFRRGEFFNEFFPCPPDLLRKGVECYGGNDSDTYNNMRSENLQNFGYQSWYDWNIAHYGTKWDVGGNEETITLIDPNTIEMDFSSAWSPPINGYNSLLSLDFEIKAYYNEPGMSFCGSYINGDEKYQEYNLENSPEEIRNHIGDGIDDMFGISEYAREIQEDNEQYEEDESENLNPSF